MHLAMSHRMAAQEDAVFFMKRQHHENVSNLGKSD